MTVSVPAPLRVVLVVAVPLLADPGSELGALNPGMSVVRLVTDNAYVYHTVQYCAMVTIID